MVSIVIPTFNDGNIIYDNVIKVIEELNKNSITHEIIIVVDGSTDDTYNMISKIEKHYKNVRKVGYEDNTGKGGAVTFGLSYTHGDIVGFIDSDLSVSMSSIVDMIKYLEDSDEVDVVIGSRYKTYENITQSFLRKLSGYTFSYIVKWMFRLGVKDSQCGAKFFKRRTLNTLIQNNKIKGFAFDVEYLHKISKNGYQIYEHPVTWYDEKHSILHDLVVIICMGAPMLKELVIYKYGDVKS